MRKLVTLLAIFLTVFTLSAGDALVMSRGDIDSVRLYSPTGSAEDPISEILEDGYIIISGSSDSSFSSVFGEIDLKPYTTLAVTGYNLTAPSLYLLDGQMTLSLAGIGNMVVYTSSASYSVSGSGEYEFIYTAKADMAYNYSAGDITVYDGIRKTSSVIEPQHFSNLLTNELNVPMVMPQAEEEEAEIIQPAEEPVVVSGSYYLRDNSVDYDFSTAGYGTLRYSIPELPSFDADAFIKGYAGYTSIPQVMSVIYDASEEGIINLVYPACSEDDLNYVIADIYDYAVQCISALYVPATPQFIKVQTTVDRQARDYIVSTSYSAYSQTLEFEFSTAGSGKITYPAALISRDDIDRFMMSYASASDYAEVKDVIYDTDEEGTVTFTYSPDFTEEEIRMVLDDVKAYLDLYIPRLFSLRAPQFTDVDTTADTSIIKGTHIIAGVPVDFIISTGGNGYVLYPTGIVSEEDIDSFMKSYVLDTDFDEVKNVVYDASRDGKLRLRYSDAYSTEEIEAVLEDVASYIDLYIAGYFSLKAPETETFIEILPPAPSSNIVVRTTADGGIPSVPVMSSAVPPVPAFTSVELKKN